MAEDPLLGTRLGKYQVESKLGQGGMGAVYRARDEVLDRVVALKVLPRHFAQDEAFRERFLREARKAAKVEHANIVGVYDFGEADGYPYIATQFMSRGSVHDLLKASRGGRLGPEQAARVVRDAARGLARAHRAELIHRDIKPANILIGDEGEARLADFGLVKDLGGGDSPLTQTGAVLGTPHYMAPEQCEGLPDIDGRADLYALGLVLYQCLSGVLPASGSTPLQIIHHRLREDPPPLLEVAPDTPPTLVALVERLLVRDRAARLGDAEQLAAELDLFLGGGLSLGDRPTIGASGAQTAPAVGAVTGALSGSDDATVADGSAPEVPVLPELDEEPATAGPVARHGKTPTLPDEPVARRREAPPPQKKGSNKALWACCCLFLLLGGVGAAGGGWWLLEEQPWLPDPEPYPEPWLDPDPAPDPNWDPTPTPSTGTQTDPWWPDPATSIYYPVSNSSSHDIHYMWASQPGLDQWSVDLLGESILYSGGEITVLLPGGVWDIMVQTSDGVVSVIPTHDVYPGGNLILYDQ